MDPIYIYGTHAVMEALKKRPEVLKRVYAKKSLLQDEDFMLRANRAGEVVELDERRLPGDIARTASHQGLVAMVAVDALMVPFKKFKESLNATPDTALIVLGEVHDPHNVGAVIRSAAAFGASAVLIPEHRQAPVTGTVIKVSAGMAFNIPLVSVPNVNTALRDLKDAGMWVYGLDGEGGVSLHEESFTKPSVFVLGNEGKGIREKTLATCDTVLTIPIHPRTESLNASVGAATVLYSWSTQHLSAVCSGPDASQESRSEA